MSTTSTQKISESDLRQFSGGDDRYRHWLGAIVYTGGVKYLAESAGAYWLIDAIASHQRKAMRNPRLREIQFWELKVAEDRSAVLTCREDGGMPPAIRQKIEYSDFRENCGLESVKLYLCDGAVLMLPSEY